MLGQKTGGRQKGTPNKDTLALFEICEKHGVDVFEGMVLCATQISDPIEKFDCLAQLAQYLYPKRKSVEIGSGDNGIKLVIEDFTKKE